ncbi:MAG: hypothetical protein ACYC2P_04845 [Paludibacteraceae bacterium]
MRRHWGFDLTIEKDIDGILRWANHIYVIYLFDGIKLESTLFNGNDSVLYAGTMSKVFTCKNFNEGYVYGFSSNLDFKINRDIVLDASVTYQYGQISSPVSVPLDHTAPLYGRVGISYLTSDRKLFAEFFPVFNGGKLKERYNPNGEDNLNYATILGENGNGTPAWFTPNTRYTYKFTPNLSLQLGINNILDTEYRTFASGINAPGRNLYTKVRFQL